MKPIRYVRRSASIVVAICSALFGFVLVAPSTRAFATIPPPGGGSSAVLPHPYPTVVQSVVTHGMAGWQITLIAMGAALLAATVAVLADRARAAQRRLRLSAT
jgi:hypothetical protein